MNVTFLSDILLAIITLIWLSVASMQDIKKREVANWLSFSLVIICLSLRAIASVISLDAKYFLFGVASMAIFFGIANLFYYLRVFAGGDAKLLTAIGTAFATKPFFTPLIENNLSNMLIFPVNLPFLLIFLFNMLFVGSAYGLLFSIFLAFRNFNSFRKEFVKAGKKYKWLFLLIILAPLLFILNNLSFSINYALIISIVLVIVLPFLFVFVKAVENSSMMLIIDPSKLTEGDWIVKKIRAGKRIIAPRFEGLSLEDISILKKRNKKVMIKQGIPFVPVFLIALLTSFFVDILELLIRIFA